MSLAVIKTGGKQYCVKIGDVLKVEKLPLPGKEGEVVFDEVLLIDDGKKIIVGKPLIEGASVKAEFIEEGKSKKITAMKYKNKTRYRKFFGHRQNYTKVKVQKI